MNLLKVLCCLTSDTFTYDAEGQILEAVENTDLGSQNKTTFTYDIIGQMTSMTDALNQAWTYTYDGARRLVEIENPAGDTVSYTHDLAGNVTKTEYSAASGPVEFFEDFAYDELSRIKTALGAEGQTTAFTYDEEDNLKTVVDALSFITTNNYDALNRVSDTIDRASGMTLMDHDDADQVTAYTDPRGIDTTFAYNGFGKVVQEVSADRGTMSYTYNNRSLVTSMTDARGIVSNYAYDHGGWLLSRTFPSAPGEDQTFTYDTTANGSTGEGKIGQISDESGSITREYGGDGYVSLDRRVRAAHAARASAAAAATAPHKIAASSSQVGDSVAQSVGNASAKSPIISTATGGQINGYTRHGVQRAIGDPKIKRAGTDLKAMLDALRSPKQISAGADSSGKPFQVFTGASARVVVNPSTGRIVSTNPLGRAGVRGPK